MGTRTRRGQPCEPHRTGPQRLCTVCSPAHHIHILQVDDAMWISDSVDTVSYVSRRTSCIRGQSHFCARWSGILPSFHLDSSAADRLPSDGTCRKTASTGWHGTISHGKPFRGRYRSVSCCCCLGLGTSLPVTPDPRLESWQVSSTMSLDKRVVLLEVDAREPSLMAMEYAASWYACIGGFNTL
jgi:hypothetical protein